MPRYVDCWILVHWVLASVHKAWATWHRQAQQRHQFSEFDNQLASIQDSCRKHVQILTFLKVLRHSPCANLQEWSTAYTERRAKPEVQSEVMNLIQQVAGDASLRTRVTVEQVLELSYAWARFLIQKRIVAYNDPVEQLGAKLAVNAVSYEGGETLHALFGSLHFVDPIQVLKCTNMRQRWSYFGQQGSARYLSGPISLINHACHDHSNVVLKLLTYGKSPHREMSRMVAVAERRITAGDKIYASYDNDTENLFQTRGIQCNLCRQ